jgi:hypothetical protein
LQLKLNTPVCMQVQIVRRAMYIDSDIQMSWYAPINREHVL